MAWGSVRRSQGRRKSYAKRGIGRTGELKKGVGKHTKKPRKRRIVCKKRNMYRRVGSEWRGNAYEEAMKEENRM